MRERFDCQHGRGKRVAKIHEQPWSRAALGKQDARATCQETAATQASFQHPAHNSSARSNALTVYTAHHYTQWSLGAASQEPACLYECTICVFHAKYLRRGRPEAIKAILSIWSLLMHMLKKAAFMPIFAKALQLTRENTPRGHHRTHAPLSTSFGA